MIRGIVADDHPIVRYGIVGLIALDPGLEVVGQASNGAEAVDLAARLRPDVVLMDLRMPGTSGIEATSRIATELPEVHVLVLTTYETDDDILGAIEAGASGYLLKAAPQEEIVAGIRAVAGGHTVLAPTIAALASYLGGGEGADAGADLGRTADRAAARREMMNRRTQVRRR